MKNSLHKLVLTALMTSLICIATMIIRIPAPVNGGYINLGDSVVLFAAWMFAMPYGLIAAALGSSLADILSGYIVFAPATFVIKGMMAVAAYYVYKSMVGVCGRKISRVTSAVIAEIVMVLGYYSYEGILYGFVPSLANLPANIIQGVAGVVVGLILFKLFEKNKII